MTRKLSRAETSGGDAFSVARAGSASLPGGHTFLLFRPRTRGRLLQRSRSTTLARLLPPHYHTRGMRMANARHLFERVLDGIKSSLSARLILIGGAAADADPTDMFPRLIRLLNITRPRSSAP